MVIEGGEEKAAGSRRDPAGFSSPPARSLGKAGYTTSMSEVTALGTKRFVVPGIVASHFCIREGDTVADIGAGSGYFLETLSQLAGPSGKLYAVDVQRNLVETLGEVARMKKLDNVDVIWGDCDEPGGSKIPDEAVDVAVLVNTFFQFENKLEALKEMKRILRSGGKLFIIDWTESFGGLGPQPDQVASLSEAKDQAAAAGLSFDREFDAGDHHYGLAFRK